MRAILEVYRFFTLAAFTISGIILLIPLFAPMIVPLLGSGYTYDGPRGMAWLGVAAVAFTFACSGLNVIGIAIYDQIRAATDELAFTRTEVSYLREELRQREEPSS